MAEFQRIILFALQNSGQPEDAAWKADDDA
jgi:hypothetical protein